MIKPASLWAFLKETPDQNFVGRICTALGGHPATPPLNTAENIILRMIEQDNEWMDERMDAQKEKWRLRKAEYRKSKKDVSHCPEDNETVLPCLTPSLPPSVPSSVHPSLPPSVPPAPKGACIITPTRGDVPDEKTVVTVATTVMMVPEAFARWWYREMVARDWTTTDGSPIGNRNWRALLKAWYNRATPQELAEINREAAKATKPVDVKPEDWQLCAERCERMRDGRCTAGKILPPQCRPHPVPPEECDKFRPSTH